MLSIGHDFSTLPCEIIETIFESLPPKELSVCASVCKAWKSVADQEILWKKFVTEDESLPDLTSKEKYIDQNKLKFFSVFSVDLIQALGGIEKVKDLPYLSFNKPRVLKMGIIKISEFNAPITVGRISTVRWKPGGEPLESSDFTRHTFLAIRFINREFDPECTQMDVNIWFTNEKSKQDGYFTEPLWTLHSGGLIGGWPTSFPKSDGRGVDFARTIDYIGRLVLNQPCGIRDLDSPIEYSKVTPLGTSTVILA